MFTFDNEFDMQSCYQLANKLSGLSMDLRYNQMQQEVFLTYSDEILSYLNKLQQRQFESGIYVLRDAGADLQASIERIDEATNHLEHMAAALKTVDRMIMNLSEFLRIISGIAAVV